VNTWNASGRFERHRVTLDTKPAWVDADRARIEQIAANLLDNALKFTPSGKAITIGVGVEGGEAVLRVADEGAGIAPGDAERVFELFVSGDRAGAGLGIGLALVKRLAELHGGSVSVQSAGTGAGTVFVVRLPAAAAPANVDAAPLARRAIASRAVLIVEDNDDARRMLEAALALEGHVVRSAANGKSGLALADQTRPDVALIDIGLPDIDGYEVARHLRAKHNGRRISLVAVTGFGQPEDQQRAIDAGFDAHIVKPVNPERLKQVLAELA
jgi:CheY-like chemotaxis protein